jgi:methyl-accepting chemotaxis protein
LNKSILAASIALPLLHAAIFSAPGSAELRLILVLCTDIVGIGLLVLCLRRHAGREERASKSAQSAVPAVYAEDAAQAPADPGRIEAPPSVALSEAALSAAGKAEMVLMRLGNIRALAKDCIGSGEAILAEQSRLRSAGPVVSELSLSLSSTREGSEVIHENTDKIFEIANNLANSAEKAFNLSHEVELRAAAMAEELAAALAETESLLAESKRISDILTIMAEIASTTNILSFNASIVAANSGVHGKPFAVVAKEMRKLSESTEVSLKGITAIVMTIQDKVKKVSDSIRAVNDGVKDEKDSLVAVAGDLQGVMLANEVIRTVSGVCVQKSAEELASFQSLMSKIDSAMRALEASVPSERIEGFASDLRKVAEIAGE